MTSATDLTSLTAPLLLRKHNFQWYYNTATVFEPRSNSTEDLWVKHTDIENEIIEDAFQFNKTEVEIDGDITLNLDCQLQYNKLDQSDLRSIKREQIQLNCSGFRRLREERFSLPITLVSLSSESSSISHIDEFSCPFNMHEARSFPSVYYDFHLEHTSKTLADVVEEAAYGIEREGTNVGKPKEGEWLALQLYNLKHVGNDIKADEDTVYIPDEIGQTCVFIYTIGCFWYKLINKILNNPPSVTYDYIKTLGPFCWILDEYLNQMKTASVTTVYRGTTLTDEQRQRYMKEYDKEADEGLYFTSFTSTSSNREVANMFSGNTLFIIDLLGVSDRCGANITYLSKFPDEEEYLLCPLVELRFIKYEYDTISNKHIIYLRIPIYP